MKEICLKGSFLVKNNDNIRVQADISGAEPLWFELDAKYQDLIDTTSVDAFFVLYLWMAMEVGADFRVEGVVSRQLSDSVLNNVKNMFLILCPRLKDIDITILRQESFSPNNNNNCATGFSGGVDSWFTALEALETKTPFSFYFFLNTGQHGKNNVKEVVSQRADVARNALSSLGKPLIMIDSNIDFVLKEGFQQRDVIGNIACILLLQKGVSSYSYSSTYSIEDSKIIEHYDMSIMDPYLLPALSTERVKFKSIGDSVTRIKKLQYISHAEKFGKKLYVCVEKDLPIKNCGKCFKCRRTLFSLDNIGEVELIKNNFDHDLFSRIRSASLVGLFASAKKDSLDKEVADEIVKKFRFKVLHLRVVGYVWSVIKNYIPESLKWRSMKNSPYLW